MRRQPSSCSSDKSGLSDRSPDATIPLGSGMKDHPLPEISRLHLDLVDMAIRVLSRAGNYAEYVPEVVRFPLKNPDRLGIVVRQSRRSRERAISVGIDPRQQLAKDLKAQEIRISAQFLDRRQHQTVEKRAHRGR